LPYIHKCRASSELASASSCTTRTSRRLLSSTSMWASTCRRKTTRATCSSTTSISFAASCCDPTPLPLSFSRFDPWINVNRSMMHRLPPPPPPPPPHLLRASRRRRACSPRAARHHRIRTSVLHRKPMHLPWSRVAPVARTRTRTRVHHHRHQHHHHQPLNRSLCVAR